MAMEKDGVELARKFLETPAITAPTFAEAVEAILILAHDVNEWRPLVEAAYQRLPENSRGGVRYWLMAIRNDCRDPQGVLQLMPKRFQGAFATRELIYSIGAALESGSWELARKLVKRLPRLARRVDGPLTEARLWLCLAQYYAQEGAWDRTIAAADQARQCPIIHEEAVRTMAEIHVARALLEVRRGLREVEEFLTHSDPRTELMVPGNDRLVQEQAAKTFRRLEEALEKILPKERQKKLGLA